LQDFPARTRDRSGKTGEGVRFHMGANLGRVPDAVQRAAKSALTRVFDALWRSGAPLIWDRYGLERSTQVGFTRLARI
jgi:hypothetical protein